MKHQDFNTNLMDEELAELEAALIVEEAAMKQEKAFNLTDEDFVRLEAVLQAEEATMKQEKAFDRRKLRIEGWVGNPPSKITAWTWGNLEAA
jgi:hypothetical protein